MVLRPYLLARGTARRFLPDHSKEAMRWLGPLVLTLAGCGWVVPTPRDAQIEDDDATSCAPDLPRCAATDASADAGADPASDAAAPLADAQAGATCTRDAQCRASEYCSRVRAQCEPRCTANDGCVGPTIAASNNRIASDGSQICYADDGPIEGGSEYLIRAWDGSGPPRTIAQGVNARVLLVADGYCYFAAPSLERAPLAGGPSEPVQLLSNAPRRAWLSEQYVWWSAPRADQLDVYRLRRSGDARAELVSTVAADKLWEGGNSTHLFRRFKPTFASCALVMAPIADLSQETTIPMSFSKNCSGALWVSEESVLFTQFEPVHYYPFRVDLANPGVETTVRLHSQELLMYQVRGPWVYGQSVVDGSSVVGVPNTVSYQRARLNGDPTERLFTPTPGTASYTVSPFELDDNVHRTFAVLDGKLIYQHLREFRLLSVALAAPE